MCIAVRYVSEKDNRVNRTTGGKYVRVSRGKENKGKRKKKKEKKKIHVHDHDNYQVSRPLPALNCQVPNLSVLHLPCTTGQTLTHLLKMGQDRYGGLFLSFYFYFFSL